MLRKPIVLLHSSVLLFGFTPILGKLISLNEYSLVWWRMIITALVFLFFPKIFENLKKLSKKQLLSLCGIGILIAIHWTAFYGSIKAANNASLTLACFGLTATFTSLIEPIINKQKFSLINIIIGLIAFAGITIIFLSSSQFDIPKPNLIKALSLGCLAAFLAALFSSINAKVMKDANAISVTFVELASGLIFLSAYIFLFTPASFQSLNTSSDIVWMIFLAVVCTNIAVTINMQSLKNISAFTANIALTLEPIYGIILAILIFSENQMLNFNFYLGTSLILLCIFAHPLTNKYLENKK